MRLCIGNHLVIQCASSSSSSQFTVWYILRHKQAPGDSLTALSGLSLLSCREGRDEDAVFKLHGSVVAVCSDLRVWNRHGMMRNEWNETSSSLLSKRVKIQFLQVSLQSVGWRFLRTSAWVQQRAELFGLSLRYWAARRKQKGNTDEARRARETEQQEDKKKTASQRHTNKKQHMATTDSRKYMCAMGEVKSWRSGLCSLTCFHIHLWWAVTKWGKSSGFC